MVSMDALTNREMSSSPLNMVGLVIPPRKDRICPGCLVVK